MRLLLRLLVFSLVFVLVSCSDEPEIEYKPQYDDAAIQLVVYSFDNVTELKRALERDGYEVLPGHKGFADIKRDKGINFCRIYVLKWDFDTTGHELHHCMTGSFHP